MSERDQRAVLWLTCAAVCWRWLVSVRAPMPSVEACRDLHLAERLAAGDFGELLHRMPEPLHGLLLAPALACGAPAFAAAKAIACLLGGLAVVPVALAAERFRRGAGVPAAVIAAIASGSVLGAAVGGATGVYTLLAALGSFALAARRYVVTYALGIVLVFAGGDAAPAATWWLIGAAVVVLPLLLLRACRRSFRALVAFAIPGLCAGVVLGPPWTLPVWWVSLAVLVGMALATVHARLRDVLLCAFAVADMLTAWHGVEPASAIAERLVPQYLLRRELRDGERVGSPMPRVQWAAGERPEATRWSEPLVGLAWFSRLGRDATEWPFEVIVLPRQDASWAAGTIGTAFARCWLPPDLQDLADERGLLVLRRVR